MFVSPPSASPLPPRATVTLPAVRGPLSAGTGNSLRRQLARVMGVVTERILVDLTDVTDVDARGFRALVAARAEARSRGLELVLVNPPRALHLFLKLTRMDDTFPTLVQGMETDASRESQPRLQAV